MSTIDQYAVPPEERTYLRELARKQASYAALPVMEKRRRMWFDLNSGSGGTRSPVVVETWTFDRDFMPPGILRCASEAGKTVERQLLRNIRNHELIDDDKVTPDTFDVGWHVKIDEFGVEIATERATDSQGYATAYHFVHPIKNLKEEFHILRPARCSVDREGTSRHMAFAEELLGDILPVRVRSYGGVSAFLTHRIIPLMGMEAFFFAMYDAPAELHRLMAYLRDNALAIMRWFEAENLLVLNNRNQDSFGSSYNFTDELPAPGFDGAHVRLCDMWLSSNSQETIGVSPELFGEYCFPYFRDVCEPMGLLYYGCCEPAHPFWEYIRRLPHLKKVSISRWCDEPFMAEALRGTRIVYSRKPNPNFLSVDVTLDEEAWAAHIRETLEATRGVQTEFIVRDVYTVHGNLENPRKAVQIARREVDRASP